MVFPFNALGLSHKFIYENVLPGSLCIDGTAGRGRDTLFLSRLVGEEGRVLAFDIQEEAVKSTKELLRQENIKNTEVHLACHSRIGEFAEKRSVDGIMFNFGYLPGGDRNIFSHAATSIPAIRSGLELLKPGGVMTLCLYHGKENGVEEKDGILAFIKTIDPVKYSVLLTDFVNREGNVPLAVLIQKEK